MPSPKKTYEQVRREKIAGLSRQSVSDIRRIEMLRIGESCKMSNGLIVKRTNLRNFEIENTGAEKTISSTNNEEIAKDILDWAIGLLKEEPQYA